MNYTATPSHISQVSAGDTILHNGKIKTLSGSNIKRCPFMGTSIWGDSYQSGRKLVIKVTDLKF